MNIRTLVQKPALVRARRACGAAFQSWPRWIDCHISTTVPRARRRPHALLITSFLLPCAAWAMPAFGQATAQPYPTQPIRMIVAYPPGGGADALIRTLSPKLSEQLGQHVVVDNRPGGNTTIGTQIAAGSKPDGYTFLVSDPAYFITPFLMQKLPYDILRDFAPVVLLTSSHTVLVVHPSVPVKTVNDLVALARSRPGQLNYASGGNGNTTHLLGELLNSVARIKIVHVPYKGSAPAISDLIAGHVTIAFNGIFAVKGLVEAGRLRAIAIAGPERKPAMPQVPTFAESGWPMISAPAYRGLVVPTGTPRDIIMRINAEAIKCMHIPEVRKHLVDLGYDPIGSSPEEYDRVIRSEMEKWGKLIRETGIKAG